MPLNSSVYRFGAFELQPKERRLLNAGAAVHLAGRSFELLSALVERAGHLVTKDELMHRVWQHLVVEEGNLAVQVSALRKVLGAHAIESVAAHGYRFALEVTAHEVRPSPVPTRRHNLPLQLTRFIGRERELAKCRGLLEKTCLLTVTGTGGLGKTRLSLAIAERRLDDYADGVWLVELAPLTDPQLVVQAIASVLGVFEQAGQSVLDAVTKFVRARRMLLVLDNCEHVVQACAHVVKHLLQAARELKVVASSREALHVPGETTYSLPTLSLPDRRATPSVEALVESEAVRLFVDRAAAAQPGFQVTEGNAQALADICTELDGIPLALELAAARVRVMSPEAIAQRLRDRFRLLKVGDRTAMPRQQTLEATVDWSYDLLTANEQSLLRRLSVFLGGWTLDAAEDVGVGSDIDATDILDLNRRLVEKSLVVADAGAERYRLLETVRLYSQVRLDASSDTNAARTRHLAHYVSLVEASIGEIPGPEEEAWVARFDLERENLRSAYRWASSKDAASALRLVRPLAFWLCMNHFDLGTPILADVLGRPEVQDRNLARFHGLGAAAHLCYYKGRYEDARRYAEEGLAIARELGATDLVAGGLIQLGLACHGLNDREGARKCLVEALAAAREVAELGLLWAALNTLAELLSSEGELEAAKTLYEESLSVGRKLGALNITTCSLLNLARVSLSLGSAAGAGRWLREALVAFEEMGATRNLHCLLSFSAGLAALRGEWERTARFYGASDRQLELLGLRREPADEASLAPLLARAREASEDSVFAKSEAAGLSLAEDEALVEVRSWILSLA